MHVIVGGCGRVGAELADTLSEEGHDVVVLDRSGDSFRRLQASFNGESMVGDITDKDVMIRAGVEHADALAAVTPSDNANLMAVEIAAELFAVPQTVARLFNPQREPSYRKMGVRYVSETRMITAALRNELRPGAFRQYLPREDEQIEIVEVPVGRAGHGLTIAEVEYPGDLRVAAVRSGNRIRLPRLDDRLLRGEVVVVSTTPAVHKRLRDQIVEDE